MHINTDIVPLTGGHHNHTQDVSTSPDLFLTKKCTKGCNLLLQQHTKVKQLLVLTHLLLIADFLGLQLFGKLGNFTVILLLLLG